MSTLRFRTALVSTAGHCAVACGFCFRADRAHGFLDVATYTRSLSRLREIGVESICLTGGEPTHHPELRQLIRLAHQFGLPVSVVTSARTEAEVTALAEVVHLVENVTVSADSRGAMKLGRTKRCVGSGINTLLTIDAPASVLHVSYWDLTDDECRELARLVAEAGTELQFSPVLLDGHAIHRARMTVAGYEERQQLDAAVLERHFNLGDGFRDYLAHLRSMRSSPGCRHLCQSRALYVSAEGQLRRCPYSEVGVSTHQPRSDVREFLVRPTTDRVTTECAAICRP
ncbi:radical SAM protein [Nocardiopsis sp. EMB25]|uniref:radical SAM protein n=1 Tax=Nocardiopsis sp. EMB25 TaxID=2835867 RepID=UPI002284DB60|nr:radical SAM protein [Nocardiopsis sp. EMB25]MCY9786970.1 radical SAM protein [Nocardiopsis sp. EMB25]